VGQITFRPTNIVEAKLRMLVAERGGTINAMLANLVASEPLLRPLVQAHVEPPRKEKVTSPVTSPVTSKSKEPKSEMTSPVTSKPTKSKEPLTCASSSSLTKVNSEKESKGVRGTGEPNPFNAPLPSILDEPKFIDAFNSFLRYRKERRLGKYVPTGMQRQFAILAAWARDYGIDAVIECIDETIRQNWQGIFQPKSTGPIRPNSADTTYTKEDL
jgi:hypothetical protein